MKDNRIDVESPNFKREALAVLKQFYGYNSFYPLQFDIIKHVLSGNDALALMPTGGGKSLCYQIPALLMDKCVIVVSPLLALMKDQVDALQSNAIPAAAINSDQSETENRRIADLVYSKRIKILYVSPERLLSEIESWSSDMPIGLIAIDEAHCISQWGHDFRPEYTKLSGLKERFKSVPILALTATADKLTREDIKHQLNIDDCHLFITSFDRPNISLNVRTEVSGKDKIKQIVHFIESHHNQAGIIYCLSRRNTENLAIKLQKLGINAKAFHAGLSVEEKYRIQRDFVNDDLQVIVATVAFGMGIDKSNVRWVIHNNMPKNIESYYQEIGRAGRDGMSADALMFYSFGDMAMLLKFAQESGQSAVNIDKLNRMQQYAESSVCRRRTLLSYFNEVYDHNCGNCDVCLNPPERADMTILVQMLLSAILRTNQQIGITDAIDLLRGSRKASIIEHGYDKIKTYGVGRAFSFAEWNNYILQILQLGIIDISYHDGNKLHVTDYGMQFLSGENRVELTKFRYNKKVVVHTQSIHSDNNSDYEGLLDKLRELRKAIAKASRISPYMVFNDKSLHAMATEKPTTKAQFGMIYGVGDAKVDKYWYQFTKLIFDWKNNNHG